MKNALKIQSKAELHKSASKMLESSTSDSKCVLCSEVGHIGKDCMANICILCLEEGHRYLECETREVTEDGEET